MAKKTPAQTVPSLPNVVGPSIDSLLRRLSECPDDLLGEPMSGDNSNGVNVRAIVSDTLEHLGLPPDDGDTLATFDTADNRKATRNLQRLRLVSAWLLRDESLRGTDTARAQLARSFLTQLAPLAGIVAAEQFVRDPDRREELARAMLSTMRLIPAGETEAQAADRLKALSSVERDRVIRATREAEENARQLRKKMEEDAAREAAARYTSE